MHDTPHTYALAVMSGLCPEMNAEFVTQRLVPVVRGESPIKANARQSNPVFDAGTTPSPFFMYYVFEALKAHGHKAEVVDCIRRWWGEFLEWGVSTTPEVWHHPGGEAPPAMHGARTLSCTFRTSSSASRKPPRVEADRLRAGVLRQHASGKTATPFGEVEVEWRREGDAVDVRLVVPKGMTARVKLPGVRKTVVGGRHHWKVGGAEGARVRGRTLLRREALRTGGKPPGHVATPRPPMMYRIGCVSGGRLSAGR